MTIFDRACFGEILDIASHKSHEVNKDGLTVAMILAMVTKEISKEWYHSPEI